MELHYASAALTWQDIHAYTHIIIVYLYSHASPDIQNKITYQISNLYLYIYIYMHMRMYVQIPQRLIYSLLWLEFVHSNLWLYTPCNRNYTMQFWGLDVTW